MISSDRFLIIYFSSLNEQIKTALAEFVPQQPQVLIDETATTSTVIDDHVEETVQESIPATTPIAEEEPQEARTSITSTGAQHSKKVLKNFLRIPFDLNHDNTTHIILFL